MKLNRFDTVFLRLFVLMWLTLVASHWLSFGLSVPLATGSGFTERLLASGTAPLRALPPGSPFERRARPGPGGPPPPPPDGMHEGPRGDPPSNVLWIDYLVRAAVIAFGAALGAQWLAAPMRRLQRAAQALSDALLRGDPPVPLDETHGTVEVRTAAQVFNAMAQRLQEQFDARGMHMAALSHDLRTPLTRLRMRLEDAPPALAEAASADIHEMSEMMDGTLAVLREQRDGRAPAPVDLRSLLQAIADDHADQGQAVTLAPGPEARASARPAALRRIVDNLVSNAVRYGGSARLSIELRAEGVVLQVDDHGPGIPEDQLELAFKPWVRLSSAHARAGHGLGLAIARDLAERDGGRLTLANRAEGGLRASLWLRATPAG